MSLLFLAFMSHAAVAISGFAVGVWWTMRPWKDQP